MFNLTSPVTGAAQTGFTTPGYVLVQDNNIGSNGKQYYVASLSGTQVGVTAHSAADVFTIAVFKPLAYRFANFVSSTALRRPPKNTYKVIVRKGVSYLAGQPKDTAYFSGIMDVPQGSEVLDPANLRAMLSLAIGSLSQQSAGLGDSLVTNSI